MSVFIGERNVVAVAHVVVFESIFDAHENVAVISGNHTSQVRQIVAHYVFQNGDDGLAQLSLGFFTPQHQVVPHLKVELEIDDQGPQKLVHPSRVHEFYEFGSQVVSVGREKCHVFDVLDRHDLWLVRFDPALVESPELSLNFSF
jgi:hypothetical protein